MATVTTIIPVWNRPKFIVRAVESVISQSFPVTEIIVVDDASTDDTPLVLDALAKATNNLVLIKLSENVGAAKARNTGANAAKGEFVAFLDSDDRWYPQKLEKQIKELEANKDIVAVLCGARETTEECSFVHTPRADLSAMALYRSNMVGAGGSSAVVSKKAFEQIGGFDVSLPSCQEWDLFIRLAEIGAIGVVREELVEYCRHSGTRISNDKSAVLLGHKMVFTKIYARLSKSNHPVRDRIIRGSHEATLATVLSSDNPPQALRHALKALAWAPSIRKLRLCGQLAKLAAQQELRGHRSAAKRTV
jgi:glycosyltransferase involved in cell wall biosynthesis